MPTLNIEVIKACRTELEKHADLRYYLTTYAMDDLDDVRAALGYDKINLDGGSYGTGAVLVYIRQHGEHVRSATLWSTHGAHAADAAVLREGRRSRNSQRLPRLLRRGGVQGRLPDARKPTTGVRLRRSKAVRCG